MPQAIVTSKGQITIPKIVRDALGLDVGAKVEFLVLQDGDALLHPVTKTVDNVFGILHQPGRKSISVAEMDESIRTKVRAKKA
jgi:AbrB family looped-hinge helix DNA binding protein